MCKLMQISYCLRQLEGSRLRHYAIRRNIVGSIPVEVIGFN
jgi:hypothetical protein